VNNLVESLGFALVLAFLWFVWPPLVLLGAGVLLVVWANTRSHNGRVGTALGAAITAAKRAYAAGQEQPTTELRRVA
jgi:fatty acid desaturase